MEVLGYMELEEDRYTSTVFLTFVGYADVVDMEHIIVDETIVV